MKRCAISVLFCCLSLTYSASANPAARRRQPQRDPVEIARDQAAQLIRQAVSRVEELDDPLSQALVTSQAALAYHEIGDRQSALTLAFITLGKCQRSGVCTDLIYECVSLVDQDFASSLPYTPPDITSFIGPSGGGGGPLSWFFAPIRFLRDLVTRIEQNRQALSSNPYLQFVGGEKLKRLDAKAAYHTFRFSKELDKAENFDFLNKYFEKYLSKSPKPIEIPEIQGHILDRQLYKFISRMGAKGKLDPVRLDALQQILSGPAARYDSEWERDLGLTRFNAGIASINQSMRQYAAATVISKPALLKRLGLRPDTQLTVEQVGERLIQANRAFDAAEAYRLLEIDPSLLRDFAAVLEQITNPEPQPGDESIVDISDDQSFREVLALQLSAILSADDQVAFGIATETVQAPPWASNAVAIDSLTAAIVVTAATVPEIDLEKAREMTDRIQTPRIQTLTLMYLARLFYARSVTRQPGSPLTVSP